MAIKSLVSYLTPARTAVKAKIVDLTSTHALIRVTGRSNIRYRTNLLMLVPLTSLQPR